MATDNETVAEIVKEMLERAKDKRTDNGAWLRSESVGLMIEEFADAVNSAHNRELAAKDDERLTIVANYETIIAAKDAEIAELRECLMEAVREKCPFTRMSCRYGEQCDYECGTKKWRKALKGSNNATK